MNPFSLLVVFLSASLWLFPAVLAFAGGPILVNSNGEALVWDSPIPLHPEGGMCGLILNSTVRARLEANVEHWELNGADLDFVIEAGELGGEVDEDNYNDFFADSTVDPGFNDGLNPVIFDNTGEIIVDIFGAGSQFAILGFAGPVAFNDEETRIIEGQAVFNCRCIEDNPSGDCVEGGNIYVTTDAELDFIMVHEIGHMIGLDHTQVNEDIAAGLCDLEVEDCDDVPTMFPVAVDGAEQVTLQRDDEVALMTLYGRTTLDDDTCAVSGSLEDVNGNPLRCVDVQAETNDPADTIAVVSGAFAPNDDLDNDGFTTSSGECLSGCGDFVLRGLNPALTYTITVKPITAFWINESGISPCSNEQLSGIVEEELDTIDAAGCVAGATHDLGTIQTQSDPGSEVPDDDDDDDGNGSGYHQPLIACALSSHAPLSKNHLFGCFALLTIVAASVAFARRHTAA